MNWMYGNLQHWCVRSVTSWVSVPESAADRSISAVCPPEPAPPPPACCRSGCIRSRILCLDGDGAQTHNTHVVSSCLGNKFHLPPCQSVHPFVHLYNFSVTSAECVFVCFCSADRGCFRVWVNVRRLAVTASPYFNSLTHTHTLMRARRCRLTGCDMDNSLHRSHQHTHPFQHWGLDVTHTLTRSDINASQTHNVLLGTLHTL